MDEFVHGGESWAGLGGMLQDAAFRRVLQRVHSVSTRLRPNCLAR